MTKPHLLILASAVLAVATPIAGIAAEPEGGAAPAQTSQPRAEQKIRYCIVETPLGSHIEKKKCLTRAEWLKQGVDPTGK
jgi:hypothetical protein